MGVEPLELQPRLGCGVLDVGGAALERLGRGIRDRDMPTRRSGAWPSASSSSRRSAAPGGGAPGRWEEAFALRCISSATSAVRAASARRIATE